MKRRIAWAAALAVLLGAQGFDASARTACTYCKAHKAHRRVHGYGRVLGPSYLPPPIRSQGELPVPTLPERRYQPGVAPPSPFLPNDLPSTFLPQKL